MITSAPLATTSRSFSYGFKPKQNIPESQKTQDWIAENIDWCISMSPIWFNQRVDDWYNLYNGTRSKNQFDHLTKTYGVEFPAGAVKHIPLIRPLISRILSEVEERDFEFGAHTVDSESVRQKIEDISGKLMNDLVKLISEQSPPGTDIDSEMEKLRRYYQEEIKSDTETGIQHFLYQYLYKHRLDRSLSEAFLDKAITGQQFYRVKVNRMGEDPKFKIIKPGQLFWASNDTKWIAECDWAVHPSMMTPTEILDYFGERMKKQDIDKVEDWLDMYHKDAFHRLNNASEADQLLTTSSMRDNQFNNSSIDHKIAVYNVEYKSIRRINFLKNDNRYADDAPFVKILQEDDLRDMPSKRKKNIEVGYIQDLYEGVRIGDGGSQGIYVDLNKVKYPVRSMSEPSKVFLSFNGLTHNGKIKPYSLIGETEDLQNLYDILHYHKENLIALSGSKGSYMDLSQIPDFKTGSYEGNLKMFMYYKKMGTAFLDRSADKADKSFNQFPSYDDTLGAGVKVILDMITHLEEVAGRVVGVNRQQLGQTQQYDGKSVNQQAQINSSMVTEYLFNEHDEFVERALTDLANASRVAYKNGIKGHYTDKFNTHNIFRLDDVNFPYSDIGIHITNKHSDKRSIAELKAMSMNLVQQGLMEFPDILPMFRQNGLAEITKTIEANSRKRSDKMDEQQQQLMQIQQQLEQAKGQGEVQRLQAQAQKLLADIEVNNQKLTLEREALSEKTEVDKSGLELDKKRVDLEAKQLEVYAKQNAVKSAEIKNN